MYSMFVFKDISLLQKKRSVAEDLCSGKVQALPTYKIRKLIQIPVYFCIAVAHKRVRGVRQI